MCEQSYVANYYSIEDIFVQQEDVECTVNTKLLKMGFLDPGSESEDLMPGRHINLPLWYIKELKVNTSYFTVEIPAFYKHVHKAVCEAESTHIELGKLHAYFYEYGRYLMPYDRSFIVGKIVFETMRQRVRYLLDISKNTTEDGKPEHKLDDIENKLYNAGRRTNTLYTNWLQMKCGNLLMSELVLEHAKKRKRDEDESQSNAAKRITV